MSVSEQHPGYLVAPEAEPRPWFDPEVAHALVSQMTPSQLREATSEWWNIGLEFDAFAQAQDV
jgi:hypothetical protein